MTAWHILAIVVPLGVIGVIAVAVWQIGRAERQDNGEE